MTFMEKPNYYFFKKLMSDLIEREAKIQQPDSSELYFD